MDEHDDGRECGNERDDERERWERAQAAQRELHSVMREIIEDSNEFYKRMAGVR